MIITVTLNTDFADVCLTDVSVNSNKWADIIARERVASGKGVNASRIIAALGGSTIATGFVGLDAFDEFTKYTVSYGIDAEFVPIDGPTRSSIYVLPREGAPTGFRAPGYVSCSAKERNAVVTRVVDLVRKDDWVLLAGSAPAEDAMLWAEIGFAAREKGAQLLWDAYGSYMQKALSDLRPDAIKLNEKEVEMTFGQSLGVRESAHGLRELAQQFAIVTTGESGSVLCSDVGMERVSCVNRHRRIEIGAGDAFAGGLLYALDELNEAPEQAHQFASAVAAAYVDGNDLDSFDQAVDQYLADVVVTALD